MIDNDRLVGFESDGAPLDMMCYRDSNRTCGRDCAAFWENSSIIRLKCCDAHYSKIEEQPSTLRGRIGVYLSGAMEKVDEGDKWHGKGWRKMVTAELVREFGELIAVYNPYELEKDPDDPASIVNVDLEAIRKSRVFIVNAGHKGVGTWMETFYASQRGITCYGFGDNTNPWYTHHVHYKFLTWYELVGHVACDIKEMLGLK